MWKWVISIIIAAVVCNHFFMTAVYLSPPNLLVLKFGGVANAYMSSFFYQNWHLFSPNPGISSTKLAIRCKPPHSDWTPWEDPLAELYTKHYRYRISGHGKLIYVYRNIGMELNQVFRETLVTCINALPDKSEEQLAQCSPDQIAAQIQDTKAYALAVRYGRQVCEQTYPAVNLEQIQFKTLEFFPLKYSERDQVEKRWSEVRESLFPPIPQPLPG